MGNTSTVECLRFGSSIPGGYWGCCAGDIFQAFKSSPNTKDSCQSVNGDGGYPQTNNKGESLFFGPTSLDVFKQRLRVGTFGSGDMANHFFLVVLTDWQINGGDGAEWLKILKDHGFEFIRTVANSVYTGSDVGEPKGTGSSLNYLFGLFRGIASGAPGDQYTPPKAWTDLKGVGKRETWEFIEKSERTKITKENAKVDTKVWNDIGETKLLTQAEIEKAGAPVILAGLRSENPQEPKKRRDDRQAAAGKKQETSLRASGSAAAKA